MATKKVPEKKKRKTAPAPAPAQAPAPVFDNPFVKGLEITIDSLRKTGHAEDSPEIKTLRDLIKSHN